MPQKALWDDSSGDGSVLKKAELTQKPKTSHGQNPSQAAAEKRAPCTSWLPGLVWYPSALQAPHPGHLVREGNTWPTEDSQFRAWLTRASICLVQLRLFAHKQWLFQLQLRMCHVPKQPGTVDLQCIDFNVPSGVSCQGKMQLLTVSPGAPASPRAPFCPFVPCVETREIEAD